MNLFIFHRDFRLTDNTALNTLAQEEQDLYLLFIFTEDQIEKSSYFSERSFATLIFCLQQLAKKVTINCLKASNEWTAIAQLIKDGHQIKKVYTNKDYSPYALVRSHKMAALALQLGFIYREFQDYLLFSPTEITKDDGTFFRVFTPYWNKIRKKQMIPTVNSKQSYFKAQKLPNTIDLNQFIGNHFNLPLTRLQVAKAIQQLPNDYEAQRNEIANDHGTSRISSALKYGVISIREAHWLGWKRFQTFDNPFNRQLIWRDFFYQVTYNTQKSKKWRFSENWNAKFNNLKWDNNILFFEKWKTGQTGVPLVDAGMNELNHFGTMHNRVRMICSSYLVKNLNIDWHWGEKYFAQQLIDYDPIINQCSWQWVAGSGFDAQPFIRIFNPYLQQVKFDPNHNYINKYLNRTKPIPGLIDYQQSVKTAKQRYQQLIKT